MDNKNLIKVENPVYMTKEEIKINFHEKQVLITNLKDDEKGIPWIGGIVRYYGTEVDLNKLWRMIDKDYEDDDEFGSCTAMYIGPIYYAGGIFV